MCFLRAFQRKAQRYYNGPFRPRKCTRLAITPLVFILLVLCGSSGFSQTRWFKYEGNPVLRAGARGAWDVALATPSRVLIEDSVYKMWYTGWNGVNQWQLGYATSPDGFTWTKYKANPVLKVGPRVWDGAASCHGYVLHTGAKYEMWYTGGDTVRVLQLGYATSADGIIWTKASSQLNPFLKNGSAGSWDSQCLSRPSVLGPDRNGSYKMWFAGEDPRPYLRIGYATGASASSWVKQEDPVLTPGNPGSWDDHSVFFPRVLFHGGIYELWYDGMREMADRRIGYATSTDGLHWQKSPENPVLTPGRPGSWDGGVLLVGDILFDSKIYHLWYSGLNHPSNELGPWQIGYAISPRGTSVSVSPTFAAPGKPVCVRVRMTDGLPLSLAAEIFSERGEFVDRVDLFDDGRHNDGGAADGSFSNSWFPSGESSYVVDLTLRFHEREFRMRNAASFTTIGPVTCDGLVILNGEPHPGDTVLAKVTLGNHGMSASPHSVEASLAAADSMVTNIAAVSPTYGDIAPGGRTVTLGYYRVFISPDCPSNKDVKLNLSISNSGITYWQDAVTLRVLPPWWRTWWAFVLYPLALIGSATITVRFVGIRKLKRRIQQLERDQALERERTRISQDMHDEVGARLTEIGILGELAKNDINDRQKTEQDIQKITETSREVIASISEIIWAMNARNDALDDLVAYVRQYASKYLRTSAIACRFEIPDAVPELQLSSEARRNVFLVVKEALHNVAKHSGATEVRVQMEFSSQTMHITIEDNGRGFDTVSTSRFSNGLRNMAKRMYDIRGTFRIWSSPGQGSKVEISVRIGNRRREMANESRGKTGAGYAA